MKFVTGRPLITVWLHVPVLPGPPQLLANAPAPARRLSAAISYAGPSIHSQRQFRRQRLTPDRVGYRMCGGSHGSPSPLAERYT